MDHNEYWQNIVVTIFSKKSLNALKLHIIHISKNPDNEIELNNSDAIAIGRGIELYWCLNIIDFR